VEPIGTASEREAQVSDSNAGLSVAVWTDPDRPVMWPTRALDPSAGTDLCDARPGLAAGNVVSLAA